MFKAYKLAETRKETFLENRRGSSDTEFRNQENFAQKI